MLKRLSLFMLISIFLFACLADLTGFKKKDNTTMDNSTGGGNSNGGGNSGGNNGDNSSDNGSGDIGGGNIGGDNGSGNNPFDPPENCKYTFNTSPVTSLVAGTYAGIYYSKDNGLTWKKSTMPIGANSVWLSLVDLGNNIVLAGSGKDPKGFPNNPNNIGSPGHGILKSTDGGVTWKRTAMQVGQWKDMLNVGNGIVVATTDTADVGGVWRSTDYGNTWSQNIDNGKPYNFWTANNPTNANGFQYGVWMSLGRVDNCTLIIGKNMPVQGTPNNLFHLSQDGGKTWFRVFEPAYNANLSEQFLLHRSGRISVALRSYSGVVVSSTHGDQWDGNNMTDYSFRSIAQSKKTDTIIAGSDGVDILAVGGVNADDHKHGGLWRSTLDGRLGTYTRSNMYKYFWNSILALDDGSFLAGCLDIAEVAEFKCQGGLYKSTDDGLNWAKYGNTFDNNIIFEMIDVRK